jgi:hypothetical protein
MKKARLSLIPIFLLLFGLTVSSIFGAVRVRGYYRSNGTYVQPHYRSAPDGNFYNNWSTKGNVNPYTGKRGTKATPTGKTSGTVSVGGYYRSDGTYVAPHHRSAPDGNPSNNWSTKGNVNPDTGKKGTKVTPTISSDYQSFLTKNSLFSIGSTAQDVLRIQGQPSNWSKHAFDYGLSDVKFDRDNRVSGWNVSTYNPLKVHVAVPATSKRAISIGSTREEVIAIQGLPDNYSPDSRSFDYGLSDVKFGRDGRVSSWTESRYNPLKVSREAMAASR